MSKATWNVAAVAMIAANATAGSQSLASRVDRVRDGSVQMLFASRPGVCGDGFGSVWMQRGERTYMAGSGRSRTTCVAGPIRVLLGRADGQTVSIRKCVACRPAALASPDVDLGVVPPSDAAKYLIDLAHHAASRNADDALGAAAMADAGDLSAEFVRLVRDDDASIEARKQALFWFGESDGPTKDLVDLYDSLKSSALRDQYAFVLSQRRDDLAIAKLIDIARHDADVRVRKQAVFWLGQIDDPKALKFFKDVLSP